MVSAKEFKQENGVSTLKITERGHTIPKSPYFEVKKRLSDPNLDIEYESFLKSLALYDARGTNTTCYRALKSFYKVLSGVKNENDLNEIIEGLDELKTIGGAIINIYPMISNNLNMDSIDFARVAEKSDGEIYEDALIRDKKRREEERAKNPEQEVEEQFIKLDTSDCTGFIKEILDMMNIVIMYYQEASRIPDKDTYYTEFIDLIFEVLSAYTECEISVDEFEQFSDKMDTLKSMGKDGEKLYKAFESALLVNNKSQIDYNKLIVFGNRYAALMDRIDEFEYNRNNNGVDMYDVESIIKEISSVSADYDSLKSKMDDTKASEINGSLLNARNYFYNLQNTLEGIGRSAL